MEKVLACKDVKEGCNFEVRGKTDDEILEKYFKHIREKHNVHDPEDLIDFIRKNIKEEH
jgi:predicted small metal-binding protein